MKAQIIKLSPQRSKYTGKTAYLICFKCEDGLSRTAWLDEGYRNYQRWHQVLKVGNHLDNLVAVSNKIINADSFPRLYTPDTFTVSSPEAPESTINKKMTDIPTKNPMFDLESFKEPIKNNHYHI